MKKIVLIFTQILIVFTVFAMNSTTSINAYILDETYEEGGITYHKIIDYSQTEILPECPEPELYIEDVLEGRFDGTTSYYFSHYGETSSFVYNGYYYKFISTYHERYEPYEKCYKSTYEVVSADINGDKFYNQEYSVIEWEFDFYSLVEGNRALGKAAEIGVGQVFPMLRTGNDTVNLHYYKSQIIKYDKDLYNNMNIILHAFAYDVNVAREEHIDIRDAKIKHLITEYIPYGDLLYPAEWNDFFYGKWVDQSCDQVENQYNSLAKSICEQVLKFDYEKITNIDWNNADLGDILDSEEGQELTEYLLKEIITHTPYIEDAYLAGDIYFSLLQIYMHNSAAQWCEFVYENILELIDVIDNGSEMKGQNLRIDYVFNEGDPITFEYFLPSNHQTMSSEELYPYVDSYKMTIENNARMGLIYSVAKTDVINSVICGSCNIGYDDNYGPYMTSYSFEEIKGNITLYTKGEFITEFTNTIESMSASYPDFIGVKEIDYRFMMVGGIMNYQHTLDRNVYYDSALFESSPHITSYYSNPNYTSALIRANQVDPYGVWDYSILEIYQNGILINSLVDYDINVELYINGLQEGKRYDIKLYNVLFFNDDTGQKKVKQFESFFTTKVYIGTC